MKKLEKEFTGNYDKVGLNKFIQIRKENGVAVYERYNTDGTLRGYEVFIVKVVPKGAPLPNGKTVEESYEQYPGANAFGKTAFDCRTLDQVERRYDELVEKVKLSAEAKEEAIKTGKPNKGRKSGSKKTVVIPDKGTKFNMKFLMSTYNVDQPSLYPIVKGWVKSGLVIEVERVRPESGKGRPSVVYQTV